MSETPATTLPWLADLLAKVANASATPSMLEIAIEDGATLASAAAAGVEPFGVTAGMPGGGRPRLYEDAYVVDALEDVPPHRFELILISGRVGDLSLREILYVLATKDAFGPETILVVNPREFGGFNEAETVTRELRFTEVTTICEPTDCLIEATGSDFPKFMQERYVPGTWSEVAAYEHLPRYAFAERMARDARVLDFGCGSGYGSAALARAASSVTGIDISADALDFARAQHVLPNLTFVQDGSFGADLPASSFDVIVCFEVIEHLDQAEQRLLLAGLHRLLAPAGKLLISTPNPRVTALYGANPYHLHEMAGAEFAELLRQHFAHVVIIEQSVEVGVFLRPRAADSESASLALEEQRTIDEFIGQSDPAIFVGVCSPAPVGSVPAIVYPDQARDLIRSRIGALSTTNESLVLRYERAKISRALLKSEAGRIAAESAVAAVKGEVHRVAGELARVQAEASAVLDDRELLRKTYEAVETEKERYATALSAEQALRQSEQTRADRLATEAQSTKLEIDRVNRLLQAESGRNNRLRRAQRDQSRQEISDLRAQLAQLKTDNDNLSNALENELRNVADCMRQIDEIGSRLSTTSDRLNLIEASTTWRTIRRLAPVLRVAGPVARPLLRSGYRLARAIVPRPKPPSLPTQPTAPAPSHQQLVQSPASGPVEATETFTIPLEPAGSSAIDVATPEPRQQVLLGRDIVAETMLDPVWDATTAAFLLRPDDTFVRQETPSTLVPPYVVVPLTDIDPNVSRPKILHVIPNVHVGGSTQLVIDIVQHLSSAYRHEVMTSSLWPGGDHVGLTVHLVREASAAQMTAVLEDVEPDLLHVHYWGLTDDPWYRAAVDAMEAYGAAALQNVNTPVAPMQHDVFCHYVFVSDYVRTEFGDAVRNDCPTSVIHPGIDLTRFGGWSPAPGRDDAIGMVYRLEDDKLNESSIELFIEIVKRRPQTKVYIIGGGRFLLPYLERTEAAGVRQNFRFTGYVPYETLPGWYDRFAVFVAPVWKESFGQVAPFAMCKRSAVAGFKVGALPEILGSDETLGSTTAETAEIVVRLLNDNERLHQLGAFNRERAIQMYDVGQMTSQYRAVYESVLGLPQGRP